MKKTQIHHKNYSIAHRYVIFVGLLMFGTPHVQAQEVEPSSTFLSGEPLKLDRVAKLTLLNSSKIQSQSIARDTATSLLQVQRGTFNTNAVSSLSKKRDRPASMSALLTPGIDVDTQSMNVGLSKMFRTGISGNFSVTLEHNELLVDNPPTQNFSNVTFSINVPLLKGRGYTSAAADETAAQLTSEAETQNYYNAISQTLLDAIMAYWEYAAAVETTKSLNDSKQRVSEWVAEAKKAVDATGNAPALYEKNSAQISRLKAFRSDQERKISDAMNQITQTKSALALAMGIPSEQVDGIGEPTEVFPLDWDEVAKHFDQDLAKKKWIASSLERRFDLKAAKLNEQGTATLLGKAKQDLLPQLDLQLGVGYGGYKERDQYINPLTSSGEERSTNHAITLNLSYPLENDTAKGLLGVASAAHRQSLLQLNESTRNARIEVATIVETLVNNLQSVKKSREVVQGYRPVLQKYRSSQQSILSNPAIIFNLIDLEKDLVESVNNSIRAHTDLAKTIVTLRHQTGLLIEVNNATNHASLANVTSLPE